LLSLSNLIKPTHRKMLKDTTSDFPSDGVTKSPNDKRVYKAYRASNDMRVLLISDPETDKAAACMTVNVGSLCDPRQLPGLAHFCEHMLFLGTEKYPQENTYSKFISDHGGHCNAATKPDETSFAFDINPANLEEALDIFAQFFISPLFTESATDREINAIQAEFEKNLTNDTRRLFQLERSLSLPGHEYSRFFSGNRLSLHQSPCARSVNVREQLLEFHEQWYSANLMALVSDVGVYFVSFYFIITFVTREPPLELESRSCIQSLKKGKAAGPDGLFLILFKVGGDSLVDSIASLLRSIWTEERISLSWDESLIVPIFKKRSRNDCANHRGISLVLRI
uniref:Peptidase_M16 domain-containing protein n=1 Tax=Echinostoma caproni TaxID=27848 RepID=A0A183ATP8_9TREM